MPIRSTSTATEIRTWHDEIELRLQQLDIHHVSYTPDGASTERRLEHELLREAHDSHRIRKYTYPSPVPGITTPLTVSIPLLSESRKPRVLGTDGKHSKKNARGSVQSGAHTLVLGNYIAHFGHLKEIAEAETSPLLKADIIGVDKQDARAAARLFSSAVIDYLQGQTAKDAKLGLTVYLFVIGELIDAQQNRSLSFHVRLKILWRSRMFLDRWFQSVNDHPHYTSKTHFISRELYDIFNLFIDSMLGLILVHRDDYKGVPLLPWLHSTECCEHFFGCARRIIKDFSFVDLIYMMPKLTLLIDNDLRSHGSANTKASAHRSGYHHSWYDLDDIKYQVLSQFPSDKEISTTILPDAYDEAEQLLEVLGIPMSSNSKQHTLPDAYRGFMAGASKFIEDLRSGKVNLDQFDGPEPLETFDADIIEDWDLLSASMDTDRDDDHVPLVEDSGDDNSDSLEQLLNESSESGLMDHTSETAIHNYGVAAAATALHASNTMYVASFLDTTLVNY